MTFGCDSSWHHRSWCCLWRDRRHKRGKSISCSISCEHQMSRPVKQICQTCVTIVAWQHTMILQWTAKPASLCKGVEVYICVCININSGIYRVHCVQTCWYVIHVYMNSMWICCLGLAARYGWYVTDGLLERPLGCIQRGTSGTCGVLTCCSRHHFYRFRWIKRQNKIALLATHTLSSSLQAWRPTSWYKAVVRCDTKLGVRLVDLCEHAIIQICRIPKLAIWALFLHLCQHPASSSTL